MKSTTFVVPKIQLNKTQRMKTGIFYGSTTGNTETTAGILQVSFEGAELLNVADASQEDLENFDLLLIGCSTWGEGELQDDFEEFIDTLKEANLAGKCVALFGYGDQESYAGTFVDALGTIYHAIKGKECKVVGFTATDGYTYDDSHAEVDGKFVGLVLDDENQSDLTDERVENWVVQVKAEL